MKEVNDEVSRTHVLLLVKGRVSRTAVMKAEFIRFRLSYYQCWSPVPARMSLIVNVDQFALFVTAPLRAIGVSTQTDIVR